MDLINSLQWFCLEFDGISFAKHRLSSWANHDLSEHQPNVISSTFEPCGNETKQNPVKLRIFEQNPIRNWSFIHFNRNKSTEFIFWQWLSLVSRPWFVNIFMTWVLWLLWKVEDLRTSSNFMTISMGFTFSHTSHSHNFGRTSNLQVDSFLS